MSVFIKGMKMPYDCDSCKVSDILECTLWKPMDIGERHPECPLVEVPTPHGRLIDADELAETAEFYETVMDIGHHAQTVIEAEGE